jgi:DNA repair protein RadC
MTYKPENTIKQWAEEDRPREKLMMKGVSALTDAELLAILLGSGTRSLTAVDLARNVLKTANNNLNTLAKHQINDLTKIPGIGEAKAITIISAMELGRRRRDQQEEKLPQVGSSKDAYGYIKPYLTDLSVEVFYIILLNRANKIMGNQLISTGGISGTVVDARLIFKYAIEKLASYIILVHNHPSGNLRPSDADIKLTQNLKSAGKFMEIPVLDHLILSNTAYFSFADEGML